MRKLLLTVCLLIAICLLGEGGGWGALVDLKVWKTKTLKFYDQCSNLMGGGGHRGAQMFYGERKIVNVCTS